MINHIEDTIAAIATPPGTGGVGIVRISGRDSFKIIKEIFYFNLNKKTLHNFKPDQIYRGWIINDNIPIDEVIILIFKGPKSYTGEDVIEIQCHGGINIVKNILKLCLKSGARMAEKGEFTKRAFLNGKFDLSKAEAVLDLIHSKTDKFSQISAYNLYGRLSSCINELKDELIDLLSLINAAIDFPDEVDEPKYSFIENKISFLIEKIDHILNTAKNSNLMRQGIKVVIAGKPNVGKSSLFNALLDLERSIVTEIPGTTRDIIQESIDIKGIPVNLVDTAGIRKLETNKDNDQIESIGINIAKSYINNADIVLFVYDLTTGLKEEDLIIYEEIKLKPVIKIGSKLDLCNDRDCHPHVDPSGLLRTGSGLSDLLAMTCTALNDNVCMISSKTRKGIELVKKEIEKIIFSKDTVKSNEFSTNLRQQECLNKAKISLLQALNSCKNNEVQDFISIDLKSALISLEEITGEVISDKIINNIFSNFCIGK